MKVTHFVLLLALFVSCRSQPSNDVAPAADPTAAPNSRLELNSVKLIDSSSVGETQSPPLGTLVAVEGTSLRRAPNGTLEVWATLRNRTSHPISLDARVQFFDQARAPVDQMTAWRRLFLPGNGVVSYEEFASRMADIAYYYVEVRQAH